MGSDCPPFPLSLLISLPPTLRINPPFFAGGKSSLSRTKGEKSGRVIDQGGQIKEKEKKKVQRKRKWKDLGLGTSISKSLSV